MKFRSMQQMNPKVLHASRILRKISPEKKTKCEQPKQGAKIRDTRVNKQITHNFAIHEHTRTIK